MNGGNSNRNETGRDVFRLEYEPETECFINQNGSITIRQAGEPNFPGDPMVCLSAARARLIAAELCRLAEEIEAE